MNKLSTYFSRLAVIAAFGLAVASCTTETTPGTTNGTTVNDSLSANSNSSTSIGLRWSRLSSDVSSDTIYITGGSTPLTQVVANNGATSQTAIIGGLTEGVPYTFSVHTSAGSSLNPITWMTAARSAGTVRIYETADNNTGEYSGLVLGANPIAVPIANNQNASTVDLVLASDPTVASGVSLLSPSITSLSGLDAGRATYFSNTFYSVTQPGLDNLYFTGNLNSVVPVPPATPTYNDFDFPISNNGDSRVIVVETADNHFARVELVPQSNGNLLGGVAGQNFVDVRVSYQTAANQPYANRGHAPILRGDTKRPITNMVVRSAN